MPASAHPSTTKRAFLLIPFAVLLVLHPLLIHGPSCGQDLAFHLQSWLDAAHQLRHGILYPRWDATAAWNAGEPRILFYPPLSWLLGAVLTLIFPITLCPTIFIAIALLAAGFTFHKLASEFASPNAALIASTLYVANPYMLFTAFERSALAELLAAAWIPLLLLALLRPTPTNRPAALATIRGIAIPLALLWLTNAPAAVIGSYTLALVATLRVLLAIFTACPSSSRFKRSSPSTKLSSRPKQSHSPNLSSRPKAAGRSGETCRLRVPPPTTITSPETPPATITSPEAPPPATIRYPEASASGLISPQKKWGFSPRGMPFFLATTYLAAALLGLTLPAIYLLPAPTSASTSRQPWLSSPTCAIRTTSSSPTPPTPPITPSTTPSASWPLTLLLITIAALFALFFSRPRNPKPNPAPIPYPLSLVALLTLLIAFLLTPLSIPIWHHLPNLAYLQFPWRLLTLLMPILALSIALLLDRLPGTIKLSPSAQDLDSETWVRRMPTLTTALTLLLPLAIATPRTSPSSSPPTTAFLPPTSTPQPSPTTILSAPTTPPSG